MDAQGLSAGGKNPQVGAGLQESLGKLRTGRHEMFAVVEREEGMARQKIIGERIPQRAPRLFTDAQCGGGSLWHEGGIGQWRKLHQPGAVFIFRQQFAGDSEGEPGLATTARAGESEQARRREQPLDLDDLSSAPDKTAQGDRQIVGVTLGRDCHEPLRS